MNGTKRKRDDVPEEIDDEQIVPPLDINGALLEGGGQILRIALPLSCILSVPVKIHSIRMG